MATLFCSRKAPMLSFKRINTNAMGLPPPRLRRAAGERRSSAVAGGAIQEPRRLRKPCGKGGSGIEGPAVPAAGGRGPRHPGGGPEQRAEVTHTTRRLRPDWSEGGERGAPNLGGRRKLHTVTGLRGRTKQLKGGEAIEIVLAGRKIDESGRSGSALSKEQKGGNNVITQKAAAGIAPRGL